MAPLEIGQSCKILTWNVHGVKDGGYPLISVHLKHFYFSCIQETRFRDRKQAQRFGYLVKQSFGGKLFISDRNGESQRTLFPRSAGIATVIHGSCPGVETATVISSATIPNRYLLVRLRWGTRTCYIHNIYAPNDAASRKTLFEHLPTNFADDALHVVCGDINLALEPDKDAVLCHPRPDSSRSVFAAWLSELDVVDAWRLHHPDEKIFSGPIPRRNRIDYIFLSDTLLSSSYHDAGYDAWEGSDHLAHHVELSSWHHPSGPGFWRLPDWLLSIPELRADIQEEARTLLAVLRTSPNPGIVWKSWKQKMKGYLKKCQHTLKNGAESEVSFARQQLEECAAAVARDDTDEQAQIDLYFAKARYTECKKEWSEFRRGVGFEQTVTTAECNSSFFFRPPRFELRHTPFDSIQCANGTVSSNPADINRGFQEHWGKIFGDARYTEEATQVNEAAQRRLLESIDRKLTVEAKTSLEMDLTVEEFAASIKTMRSSSAPGPDGFTAAFYQVDPDLFGEILLIVFRYQLERGELLPHQRHSSVALLFKKGDRSDPGNFRPISLIPVEVKVLSRLLTHRLKPFIATLVHPDQKGFIPGRSIHQQVMLVRDLQHLVSWRGDKAVAAFLDFAKAYDRVNRDYLFKVMERQGFGSNFLAWIRLLYNGAMSSLMINGWALDPLLPSRGVKQGDSLSPYLFALALEPLGNLLRSRRDLGVAIDASFSIPVAFFADDTVLFSRSVSDLAEQLQLVDCYCAGSGAKLNPAKSVIMSLNNHRSTPRLQPLHSVQAGETVKYLGIPFGSADTSTELATKLDQKIINSLRMWKGRARTLMGRRLIVQAVILSMIWYFTTTVDIPIRFIRRWQSTVTRYILYNRIGSGGVSIVRKGLATQLREADGIGVPVILTNIRRQRFVLLQQLALALHGHCSESELAWYRPIAELLRLRSGVFSRSWSCDFLFQDPPHPAGWRATMLPLWWRRLLQDWRRLKWPNRGSLSCSRAKTLQYALFSPVWWNTAQDFQVSQTPGSPRKPLGTGSNTFRFLCRELAAKQKWYLADFLDEGHRWPTAFGFLRSISTELQQLLGSRIRIRDIVQLYHQLSQIFHRLLPNPEFGGVSQATRDIAPPAFGVLVGQRARFFPNLRLQEWNYLLRSEQTVASHPMCELGCSQRALHATLTSFVSLRRYMIPVVHDVMLRLFYGDLIVGSRLYFLRSLNPTVQQCVRESCTALETVEHCFFSCPALSEMWKSLWIPWSKAFTKRLDWKLLLFPTKRDIQAGWRHQQNVLLLLWRVHTAIVFHAEWRLRNDIHFHETQAQQPSVPSLLNSFGRHCRFIFQHSNDLGVDGVAVAAILERLGFEAPPTVNIPLSQRRVWIPQS